MWTPIEQALSLWRAATAGGAVPFGHRAAETFRIEAGRPKFPADMNEETIALEARLDGAISFTKGCYVGQEVVSRATYIGQVHRQFVGFVLDAETPPAPHAAVAVAGKSVGSVTSAARSAWLGKTLALGYIRREHAAPETPVTVAGGPACVASLPFVRR